MTKRPLVCNLGQYRIPFGFGSVSEYVKGFIVVRVSEETIAGHERFHAFEDKIHFWAPAKSLLPSVGGAATFVSND